MFERFTERARQVVLLAEDEARGLGHDYIGTEHVLLGLVRLDEGVAARILLDFDADAQQVRSEVLQAIGPTPRAGPPRTERHRPPPVPDLRRVDWEYRVDGLQGPDELTRERPNERGGEGWELVAVVPKAGELLTVFKRPRPPRRPPPPPRR